MLFLTYKTEHEWNINYKPQNKNYKQNITGTVLSKKLDPNPHEKNMESWIHIPRHHFSFLNPPWFSLSHSFPFFLPLIILFFAPLSLSLFPFFSLAFSQSLSLKFISHSLSCPSRITPFAVPHSRFPLSITLDLLFSVFLLSIIPPH